MAESDGFNSDYTPFNPLNCDDKSKGFGYYFGKIFKKTREDTFENTSLGSNSELGKDRSLGSNLPDHGSSESSIPYSGQTHEPSSFSQISVLKRIKRMIDKSGMMQHCKESEFRQHWLPDDASHECSFCQEKFTTFRRRHHCRICGQIFCSKCCKINISGKIFGYEGELRSCLHCCKAIFSLPHLENLSSSMINEFKSVREKLLITLPPECLADFELSADDIKSPNDEQRTLHFKKPSYGFIEENYACKNIFEEKEDDSSLFDGISSERELLLKDSQQLHLLCSLIFDAPNHIYLDTHWHRLRSFPNSFVGKELVKWLLDHDKASSTQAAVAIGQALLEAGLIICVSQHQQFFLNDYIIYQPVKQRQENFYIAYEATEEPRWVKEIPIQAENEKDLMILHLHNKSFDRTNSLSTSSSSYCLDLNIKENVVLMSKPKKPSKYEHETHSPSMVEAKCSSVSSALSASAIPFRSDHSTSAYLLAKEVQEAVRTFERREIPTKASGWLQLDVASKSFEDDEEMDDEMKLKLQMQKKLQSLWSSHESDLLAQLLSYSKLPQNWLDVILPAIYTVSQIISPDVKNDGDEMDIRKYVHFKKLPHQAKPYCEIINGVVCTKNVVFKSMTKKLTNPAILLIASNIDYQRGNEARLINIENLEIQEKEYLKNLVSKLLSLNPNVILIEKNVSFYAVELLQEAQITLVTDIKPSVMERISRCTQSQILSSVDAPITASCIGMCHSFYIRTYINSEHSFLKTLMFFDGCATHLGCTVMLSGHMTEELKKVKDIMYFMIYALYNWKLERSFLMDEQVFFSNLLDDSRTKNIISPLKHKDDFNKAKEINSSKKISPSDSSGIMGSSSPIYLTQEGTTKELVCDYSDPLHQLLEKDAPPNSNEIIETNKEEEEHFLEKVKVAVFSISPFVKVRLPYLLTENGKKSMIKKYFVPKNGNLLRRDEFINKKLFQSNARVCYGSVKNARPLKVTHVFSALKWTTSVKDSEIRLHLADFRARGGVVRKRCRCRNMMNDLDKNEKVSQATDCSDLTVMRNLTEEENVSCCRVVTPNLDLERDSNPLHPFHHQHISVLFSVYSHSFEATSTFCVNPWIIRMEFYGKNDIPLGAFLETYCFRTSYSCPSTLCTTTCVSHVRKFAHQDAEIEVCLKRIDGSHLQERDSTIYMSNWCDCCSQGSTFIPMSSQTWAFSFAKYLEIHFHEPSLIRRISPACSHLLTHCFVKRDIITTFKYLPISVKELILPPIEIVYSFKPLEHTELVNTVQTVSVLGYSIFSTIHEHLVKISMETTARWSSFINSFSNKQKHQRNTFKEAIDKIQLKLIEPSTISESANKSSEQEHYFFMFRIMENIVGLKSFIAQVVVEWNSNIQEFLQLKKKDEKVEKLKSSLGKQPSNLSLSHVQHFDDSSTSGNSFDDPNYQVENAESEGNQDQGSIDISRPTTESSSSLISVSQDSYKESSESTKDEFFSVSDSMEASCSPTCKPNKENVTGHKKSYSDSSSIDVAIEKTPEKRLATSSVKNILTNLWSSSFDLMVKSPFLETEHYYFLSEGGIPLAIYEKEPSSIIAYALASQEYSKIIKSSQRKKREQSPSQFERLGSDFSFDTLPQSACEKSTSLDDGGSSSTDLHFEMQWNDQDANFYCKVYFAEHFHQMRNLVFPFGEEQFVRSLSRCIIWEPKGGKSGSLFCKTTDERFILKEMSRPEKDSFLDFGPSYIGYIMNRFKENQPTVLTKIVGVYRIGFKNNSTKDAKKMDILVMENLFYQKNIKNKYDLKGSVRNRLVNITGKEDSELVLMDENLLKMSSSTSLYLRSQSKDILMQAIEKDSCFLSKQLIMDYSLLVGIDESSNQLIVGIIDYIRTFTWDKELEYKLKVLGASSGKLPTVISPEHYRSRFCQAMEKYFSVMPDQWYEFGEQLYSTRC